MSGAALNVLILGASYGLLPGVKLSLAGHRVTMVGRAEEIEAMAQGPLIVRIAGRRGGEDFVLSVPVAEEPSPRRIALRTPGTVDATGFDLVILAMQEPQYGAPAVAALMAAIAAARLPCLSIMNLAPPPFLARLSIMDSLDGVYHSRAVWDGFDPQKITLASPDPQAIRPDPASPGQLQVTLPSNFKAAPFALAEDQALLRRLAADMSHLEVDVDGHAVRPPVALIASTSLFVPLAKWPMLLAGNCRCVMPHGIRTIAEAVHADLDASAAIYSQVQRLAVTLGAGEQDLVRFSSYAKAAARLTRPSSLARGLEAGSVQVERIDLLVRGLMMAQGMEIDVIDQVVGVVDMRIARNRNFPPSPMASRVGI